MQIRFLTTQYTEFLQIFTTKSMLLEKENKLASPFLKLISFENFLQGKVI